MNNNFVEKVNSAFDTAVIFFLFSGSLYFIYYSLRAGKIEYILFSLLVYFISFGYRQLIGIKIGDSGFTEAGIFLISFLFLAYLITLFNLDNEVKNYLPDKILSGSWSSFVFLMIISVIPPRKVGIIKFTIAITIVATLILLNIFNGAINTYLQSISGLSGFLIGFPLIYLLMVLMGLKSNTSKT